MQTPNSNSNQLSVSVWSVDRIGRLIVGLSNVALLLAFYFISPYFLIGLCFINLNLIFTSITDNCPFKRFLKRLGAKEREEFYNSKGELMNTKNRPSETISLQQVENI